MSRELEFEFRLNQELKWRFFISVLSRNYVKVWAGWVINLFFYRPGYQYVRWMTVGRIHLKRQDRVKFAKSYLGWSFYATTYTNIWFYKTLM